MRQVDKGHFLDYIPDFAVHPSLAAQTRAHLEHTLPYRQHHHLAESGMSHPISNLPHPQFFQGNLAMFRCHDLSAAPGAVAPRALVHLG